MLRSRNECYLLSDPQCSISLLYFLLTWHNDKDSLVGKIWLLLLGFYISSLASCCYCHLMPKLLQTRPLWRTTDGNILKKDFSCLNPCHLDSINLQKQKFTRLALNNIMPTALTVLAVFECNAPWRYCRAKYPKKGCMIAAFPDLWALREMSTNIWDTHEYRDRRQDVAQEIEVK